MFWIISDGDPNDTVFKPIIRKIQEDIWVKGSYAGSDAATCYITQEAESSVVIVFYSLAGF